MGYCIAIEWGKAGEAAQPIIAGQRVPRIAAASTQESLA
jgi:hypothetical protein